MYRGLAVLMALLAEVPAAPPSVAVPVEMYGEKPLLRISATRPGDKVCGEYFTTSTQMNPDGKERVGYFFVISHEQKRMGGFFELPSTLRVRIDETRRVPTVQFRFEEDEIVTLVRLSEEQYQKSTPCLPKPIEPEPPKEGETGIA